MYSISEVSKLTGITAHTLRYYEKIGVLPAPKRDNGRRAYSQQDFQFIQFIHGLKQTGMKLEEIIKFAEDGCLVTKSEQDPIQHMVQKRIAILDTHLENLENQLRTLTKIKALTIEKKDQYHRILKQEEELSKR